jgi:hypothetical protein
MEASNAFLLRLCPRVFDIILLRWIRAVVSLGE